MRIPFFIETVTSAESANVQICRKIAARLFNMKVSPLPFATTLAEAQAVLGSMRKRAIQPGIFVINSFGIEHLMPELDRVMGEIPAVFFRRQLYGHTPCLKAVFGELDPVRTTQYLGHMTPRLAVAWTYGAKNSTDIADSAARNLHCFLETGDFTVLERARLAARVPAVS